MNNSIDIMVRESAGKFLTLTFVKKDGSIRKINGRIGVQGAEYRKDTQAGDPYLLIWECKTRGYRRVSLESISRIAIQNHVLYSYNSNSERV